MLREDLQTERNTEAVEVYQASRLPPVPVAGEVADASKGDQGLFGDGFDLRRLASLSSILPEVSLRRRSVLRDLSDLSTRMRRRSTRPRSSSTAPADADPEMAPSDADGQPVETTPVREIS